MLLLCSPSEAKKGIWLSKDERLLFSVDNTKFVKCIIFYPVPISNAWHCKLWKASITMILMIIANIIECLLHGWHYLKHSPYTNSFSPCQKTQEILFSPMLPISKWRHKVLNYRAREQIWDRKILYIFMH